ncbi:MAG: RtcB family protein [Burkholderiales bacterium]|nr:RtcB family protein [Burkholderiales bacterium]
MEVQNTRMWVSGVPVEDAALAQIRNMASLPILAGHVAIMPDVHLGKGATVGTIIPTEAAIIPAAVGVDIGCGMCAVRLSLKASDLPDSLANIRHAIERSVPVGVHAHKETLDPTHDGLEGIALKRRIDALDERFWKLRLLDRLGRFNKTRLGTQLGTLGGGNHFIELCLDEAQSVWVMLHSGSRNVGNTIGTLAIEMAKTEAAKRDVHLPDRDLAWLDEGSEPFEAYVEALLWAQDYAATNRDLMMHLVMKSLRHVIPKEFSITQEAVNCHHNYVQKETHFGRSMWITRKGAVSARKDQLGIIPGSMGAKSFIVRGKGHAEAYNSCSHGAGRRMSRTAASKNFTVEDLARQTDGVECRKDGGVIDEIPAAYKDIDAVMAAQADLVEIVHTLKQVLCVKG